MDHGVGPAINFTRGTNATFFDASGTLRFAPSNAIRNSQAGGAVVGAPGTLPTHWFVGAQAGISTEVVATGTENGLAYVDVKFSGTNSSGGNLFPNLFFDAQTTAVASLGQTWTGSFYTKIVAGSMAGLTNTNVQMVELTAAAAVVATANTAFTPTSSLARYSATRTLTGATTERVYVRFLATLPNGNSFNLTLRIAAPQLERNATPSEYIPTTGTANFDQPRFDHDPATGASRGLLIEEARTNSIRNSQAGGAVVGAPGTIPTNWDFSAPTGISREVVATGTANGLAYIDIKVSGTSTQVTQGNCAIRFDGLTQVAASSGQSWSASCYIAIIAGSSANLSNVALGVIERNSGGGLLERTSSSTISGSSLVRYAASRTFTNASTAHVTAQIELFNIDNGDVIDITLRIAAPQLEQGAFPTSYIPTTSAAATRSADSAVVTPISSFYNQSEGTLFAEASSFGNEFNATSVSFSAADNANERFQLRIRGGSVAIVAGGVQSFVSNATDPATNVASRKCAAAATDNFAVTTNGGAVEADTSGAMPAVTHLLVGRLSTVSTTQFANGHIRKIAYWPKRLSNTLLQQLTT